MSTDQLHGKDFENWIKGALFRGAPDHGRSGTSEFDVEAEFDRTYFLATSIKASKHTKSSIVHLSDAGRFWKNDKPFRMLVGLYRQLLDRKEFFEVHEFLLHGDMLNALKGELTYEEVHSFHRDISIRNFPLGTHTQARLFARHRLTALKDRRGAIVLNPKIDSKSQRRLQCSVKLGMLIDIAQTSPLYRSAETGIISNSNYTIYTESIGTGFLPVRIKGSARELSKRSEPDATPTQA